MKKITAFIFACTAGASLYAQDNGCNHILRGTVLDSLRNTPLNYTHIEIQNGDHKYSANTNKAGNFRFDGLCLGNLQVHISHLQCEHVHLTFQLRGDTSLLIYLKHIEQELEVNVTAKGNPEKDGALSGRTLENRKGLSISQMMQDIAGVSLLKTGSSISKPIVNGMHSNRVIIINNGIRQEGQNWGMEHAPEIDGFLASEIELLKGAEALRYACDGIGGVVVVRPPSIFREKSGLLSGEVNMLGFTNGRGGAISGFLGNKISEKVPLYWRIQGTTKRSGNTRTPDDILANTGSNENNYSANLAFRNEALKSELYYSCFNTQIGIYKGSQIGNLADLQRAISSDRPLVQADFSYQIGRPYQQVRHQLMKFANEYTVNAENKIELILSLQKNHRSEYDVLRSANSYQGPSFDYYISTYMGDLVWTHHSYHALNVKAGIYGLYQSNAYTGRFFIPGFYQKGAAAYLIASRDFGKLHLEGALRSDARQLSAYLWHGTTLDNRVLNFSGFTYLFQVSRPLQTRGRITFTHSLAWRPPAPNELYANGLHQGLASIEIGDSSLHPEKAFNFALNYSYQGEKLALYCEGYYKLISGFINLVPTGTPQLTIRGAFPVFREQQVDASIYGLNYQAKRKLGRSMYARSAGNILFGHDLSSRQVLSQMPPLSGKTGIGWDKKKVSIDIYAQYAMKQWRYIASIEYKTPPPAYCIAGLDASFRLNIRKQPVKLTVTILNLANQRYREYLNRFRYYTDEQGFSLMVRITLPLNIHTRKH